MKFRTLIATAAVAALPLFATAATIVVPAAGTGPGANASQWQSELTLHNAGPRAATISISFHRGTEVFSSAPVTIAPGRTESIADIVKTRFGIDSATGALVLGMSDRDARSVALTSRTFNVSPGGEFGQDIPAVDAAGALRAGDTAALPGPASLEGNRFNFGLYVTEAADVEWRVVRANGTVAGTKSVSYAAGTHAQYNSGIQTLLDVAPQSLDTVQAHVRRGRALFYGSIINATGDPTFVPGNRVREDILIHLTGVDLDENGTIDIADQNGDAVLDAPVQIFKSLFPNYFQVVARGEFDEAVTLEVVSAPASVEILDDEGTLRVIVTGNVTATSGEIVLRATSEGSTQLIVIPVLLR